MRKKTTVFLLCVAAWMTVSMPGIAQPTTGATGPTSFDGGPNGGGGILPSAVMMVSVYEDEGGLVVRVTAATQDGGQIVLGPGTDFSSLFTGVTGVRQWEKDGVTARDFVPFRRRMGSTYTQAEIVYRTLMREQMFSRLSAGWTAVQWDETEALGVADTGISNTQHFTKWIVVDGQADPPETVQVYHSETVKWLGHWSEQEYMTAVEKSISRWVRWGWTSIPDPNS